MLFFLSVTCCNGAEVLPRDPDSDPQPATVEEHEKRSRDLAGKQAFSSSSIRCQTNNMRVLKWQNSFLPQEWGSVWLRLVSTSWQSNSSQMPSVTTQRSLSESGVFVEPRLEASSELPERVASPVWFQVVW